MSIAKTANWSDRMLGLAIALSLAVVVLSAYLRISAAGLGCTDWPACYARLDAVQEGATGPARAIHRVTASTVALIAIGYLLVALRRRRDRIAAAALVTLTALLAVVGLHTPSPLEPWVTLVNVAGGMALLGLYGWLWLRPEAPAPRAWNARRLAAALGVAVVYAQIALGAWASAHYAEPACPGLLCPREVSTASLADAFDPARRLAVTEGRIHVDGASVLVQRAHRLGAFITFLYVCMLVLYAPARTGTSRQAGLAVLALLLAQAALGVGASLSNYPLWAAIGHNALAAILLLAVVRLYHVYARD
jgi:cytochrome c oxidase assembly protein subunit 15